MASKSIRALVLLLAAASSACGVDTTRHDEKTGLDAGRDDAGTADAESLGPPSSAYAEPPAQLSAWNLFEDAVAQRPAARTLPYDVIAPLFSDYTTKRRFLYVPQGKTIGYEPTGLWKLPVGSVLI